MNNMKLCEGNNSCGKLLPLSAFSIIKRSGNPMGKCKECMNILYKIHYAQQKEKIVTQNEDLKDGDDLPAFLQNLRNAWV